MKKKLPDTLIDLCQDWQGAPIRLMFQDEARFGRINLFSSVDPLKIPKN